VFNIIMPPILSRKPDHKLTVKLEWPVTVMIVTNKSCHRRQRSSTNKILDTVRKTKLLKKNQLCIIMYKVIVKKPFVNTNFKFKGE
jgi:hypothetical protein